MSKGNRITVSKHPAIYSVKPGILTITFDHDILHSTGGQTMGPNFYNDVTRKLNDFFVHKFELTSLDGLTLPMGTADFNGWSEEELNKLFRFNDALDVTYEMGYNQDYQVELNPAGVTIIFEFTD